MLDLGSVLFGAGGLLSGAAALVTALRTGRKLRAVDDKVGHVAAQVTTSNGKTLAAIVEGTDDRRILAAPSGDLTASEAEHRAALLADPESLRNTLPAGGSVTI